MNNSGLIVVIHPEFGDGADKTRKQVADDDVRVAKDPLFPARDAVDLATEEDGDLLLVRIDDPVFEEPDGQVIEPLVDVVSFPRLASGRDDLDREERQLVSFEIPLSCSPEDDRQIGMPVGLQLGNDEPDVAPSADSEDQISDADGDDR